MAQACGLNRNERVIRIIIGLVIAAVGVVLRRRDVFTAVVLFGFGTAMVVAAALGH
jgi:hypothetical protein